MTFTAMQLIGDLFMVFTFGFACGMMFMIGPTINQITKTERKMTKEFCKNCVSMMTLNCHPSNKNVGKGSILKKMGYVCTNPEMDGIAIFMDKNMGSCECFTPKSKIKKN